MTSNRRARVAFTHVIAWACLASAAAAQANAPIRYTVHVTAPATQMATVDASYPTSGRDVVTLMMAVWSPGYYVREDYATRVSGLVATAGGRQLRVEQVPPNRWQVHTDGASTVNVSYTLRCDRRSVTGNSVDTVLAVLNGAPTFITLAGETNRPHEVLIDLPPAWHATATSLAAADAAPNHYRAQSFDELVDSPIIAGNISFHSFVVDGSTHILADVGAVPPEWDGAQAAANLEKFVRADRQFWGFLPFRKYVFLNVFRRGAGGLEHLNSTLLTSSPTARGGGDMRWLQYVSHEYFHAFNVKRLRPVELGPFDYETPPSTPSLWISEGVTTYYGDRMVARGGLGSAADFLRSLSAAITSVQNAPGRRVQTLEQASLAVFRTGGSGIGGNRDSTVSYYDKGHLVGFLLDAHIQHLTGGARSFDDVMRRAYERYSGARGFTPAEFEAVASEAAGKPLDDFFQKAVRSTEELDYSEALDWFGLRLAQEPAANGSTKWTLEVRPDATPAQRARLAKLTESK